MSNVKGFTLIEVLVALTIVSVGVLAIGSFTISTLGSGQTSRERLTAVHFAEQVMEEWQQSGGLPMMDTNYCQTNAAWVKTTSSTPPPCPTSGVSTTSVASCIPLTGTKLAYDISAIETPLCGPPKMGGSAFDFYSAASPPFPETKLVRVSWTRKGKTRSVFLTHVTKVP